MNRILTSGSMIIILWVSIVTLCSAQNSEDNLRMMRYSASSLEQTIDWQNEVRSALYEQLKVKELLSQKTQINFDLQIESEKDLGVYYMKVVSFMSTPTRRIRVVLTIPKNTGKFPAVVCIHGHGGTSHVVYDKHTIYHGFAHKLAQDNYITIAPMVSQHEVYEKGMLLMGERLFDIIRCVDFLESLKEVDPDRIGCAGLSLGGEMTMWLGAMDTRIKATISSGFLTNMDHMEQNHCMCWKFPGLRTRVDFADIYGLIAPRALQCQNGIQEPPSQFYVPLAKKVLDEIKPVYYVYGEPDHLELVVHAGGHEVEIPSLQRFFKRHLGGTPQN